MRSAITYIGIGSNLGDPLGRVRQAFRDLETVPQSRCVARSPCYRSKPVGPAGQPDYINAVAALETCLLPTALLAVLQAIENAHGRIRAVRWGPRTLDLDVLVYGDLVQADPSLTIPHPRLHERAFVLYPLGDIAPELLIPGFGKLTTLLDLCPPLDLEKLEEASW